ncbi:putative NAD(+)--arginine ADP-ribosyltransferase Mav [Manduca sexta]|uniref:putative NAD(+)--arginine ADP-ribosyltransferase Mav n=1 Tax=Manduca sexta TaxID=7130 RepID=UPI00188EED92|nr:putative NAD(+)--arginine ADP-ribosyltransferase Mav [Manduca sexta]
MAESRPMDTDQPVAEVVGEAKHAMLATLATYIKGDPIFSSYVRSILVANEPRAVPDSPESPASPASSIDSPESPAFSDSPESPAFSDEPSPPGSPAGAGDPDLAMDSDPGAPQLSAVPVACASKRPVSPAPSESRSGAASSDLDDDGFTIVRSGRRKKQRSSDASASQAPSAPPAPSTPKPAASKPAPASSTKSSPPQPKGPKNPPKVNLQLPEGVPLQSFFDALTTEGIKIPPNAWNSGKKMLSLQPGSISDHRELTKFLDSKRYHYYTFALLDERRYRYVIRGIPIQMSAVEVQQGLQAKGIAALEVHRMHRQSRASQLGLQYEMVLVILATPDDVKALYEIRDISGLGGFTVETPH